MFSFLLASAWLSVTPFAGLELVTGTAEQSEFQIRSPWFRVDPDLAAAVPGLGLLLASIFLSINFCIPEYKNGR